MGTKKDQRLITYCQAMDAMCHDDFTLDFPTGNDDIGRLGKALQKLSAHLQYKSKQSQSLKRIMVENNLNLRLNDVLNHVYDTYQQLIPFDKISLALFEKNDSSLKLRWIRANYKNMELCSGSSIQFSDNCLQHIINKKESLIVNDLSKLTKKHPESKLAEAILKEKICASLSCPLIAISKPIGFVFLSSNTKKTYKKFHKELLEQIASQLAITVEKDKLYKMSRSYNRLIAQKQKWEQRATHDALTGLFNRPAILDIYHKQITRAKRGGFNIAVIMIDIDHFKKINDTCGHLTGDIVLCEIAERLLHCSRSQEETFARQTPHSERNL